MIERFVAKTPAGGDVVGTANGLIDAAAEAQTCTIEDLSNVVIHAVQVNDAGTVVAHIEATLDGTNWFQVGANLTEASWPAANNAVVERTLSDANGMPLAYKAVRMRASALAAGGTYIMVVGGRQKHGYR